MRLRLFHTATGARIAYREHGTGRPLVLVHEAGLSHREFEPVCAQLEARNRLILCDLPGHGDSDDRPGQHYATDTLATSLAALCREVGGRSPCVAGHGLGADLLLRAIELGLLTPGRLVLMPCRLHRPPGTLSAARRRRARAVSMIARTTPSPLGRRAIDITARGNARRLTASRVDAVDALLRHATADLAANPAHARAWAAVQLAQPRTARTELLDLLPQIGCPVLLLWADRDPEYPLRGAEEALDLLSDGQLRVLPGTGHLLTFDDPVGVARELAAFCR